MSEFDLSCGAQVAHYLEQLGVQTVFGIPGNHTLELYRGLQNASLTHVTTRHEQGAAFMADGYARASGNPGVCFLISGPGLLNAATAIAQANADSVPMLVITAVAARDAIGFRRGHLHELPHQSATAAGFCRDSRTLMAAAELAPTLSTIWAELKQRPGAYHLEIPLDVMREVTPVQVVTPTTTTSGEADIAKLEEAATRLAAAESPIVILGGGAAGSDLVKLIESIDAPVLNTVNAKGVIPSDHPLSVGGSPSLLCVKRAIADADVVLALGTEFGETDYDLLMNGDVQLSGDLIRVDCDPEQLNGEPAPTLAINMRVETFVSEFPLTAQANRNPNGTHRAAALRAQVKDDPHFHSDFDAFFASIKTALPDAIVVGDSTRPTYYASWIYECNSPRSYFHSVSGFGTLGYALPAAFGAQLCGTRPVVGLIGDGGLQFTLPELATGVDQQLPVPIIVWCNQGYEEITNSLAGQGVTTTTTQITSPDWETIAKAYRCGYAQPKDHAELKQTLKSATQHDRPTIIAVHQDQFVHSPSGQWYG